MFGEQIVFPGHEGKVTEKNLKNGLVILLNKPDHKLLMFTSGYRTSVAFAYKYHSSALGWGWRARCGGAFSVFMLCSASLVQLFGEGKDTNWDLAVPRLSTKLL